MKRLSLLVLLLFMVVYPLSAQNGAPTDRELLLELVKQQTETNKQVAIIATKLEGVDKRFDDVNKRMDMLLYIMLGLLAGIFGLIAMVFWDRRAAMKPIEAETQKIQKENIELKQEIAIIKKKQLKTDNFIKKIGEIDSRFAGIL